MDDDSCSKFIGSLTKYLQSLCHSYVDFDSGVELVGHIYLNVDTGKKIDYVLNESVCKNGANVVKFTSNSYHAQPVEKQKKETPKKTPPEPNKNTPEKKKTDDDDVIIVGSEASRNRGSRQGQAGSGSRPSIPANQMQRGQQRPMQQQAPGVFRHPRGPQPRMAVPRHNVGSYRYPMPNQAAMSRVRGPQPRNYLGVGAGYNPNAAGAGGRLDQMHMNNPYSSLQVRPPQAQGRRASDPVDTDVTFMREEYVPASSQQNARIGSQPGQNVTAGVGQGQAAGARLPPPPPLQSQPQLQYPATTTQGPSPIDMMNQRFGYNQRQPSPQYVQGQPQHQQQQHFRGPHPQVPHPPQGAPPQGPPVNPGQVPVSGVSPQNMAYGLPAAQQSMGGMPQNQQVPNAGAPGVEAGGVPHPQTMPGHGVPVSGAAPPPSFLQNQSQVSPSVSGAGGMPLPVTTHTIFDSNPPVTSTTTGIQPSVDAGGSTMLNPQTAADSMPPASTAPISSAPSFPPGVPGPGPGMATLNQPNTSMGQGWGDRKPVFQPGMGQTMMGNAGPPPPSTHPRNTPPATASGPGAHNMHTNPAPSGSDSVGNIFEIFAQQQQQQSGPLPQPSHLSPPRFAHGDGHTVEGGGGGVGNTSAHVGGEAGSGEPDFFSQLLEGNPTTSSSDTTQPVGVYQAQSSITPSVGTPQLPSMSPLHAAVPTSESEVKVDPGQIGVAIATAVIQEATEAAAHEGPESFLTPHGMAGQSHSQGPQHQGGDAYRKRSGSTSSASLDTPSPLGAQQTGAEGHLLDAVKIEAGSQQQTSDYESGWDSGSTSAEKSSPSHPGHPSLRNLSIPLVPVDSSVTKSSDAAKQSPPQGQDEGVPPPDGSGMGTDDDSSVSDPEPDQDDDDPSYTPGRGFSGEKGGTKRPRGRPPGKGKKRKTDKGEGAEEGDQEDQQTSLDMDVTAEVHQAPGFSPSIETDNAESGDSYYKPGTFVLVNTSKESERASRMRPVHTPAEVIATPAGKEDGLWVHLLVASGSGLWRLPNVEHLVDHCVEPGDVVKTLNNASVKIIGSKVYYKFDDL